MSGKFRPHSGSVGLTERRLRQLQLDYQKIYLHPNSQASYYPGGAQLHVKLLFSPEGKIFGSQIIGTKGVAKRIDVIAGAMRANLTVSELASLELSYAPPFNSAKDPVNLAGMIAENVLAKRAQIIHADELAKSNEFRLDVREVAEFELGTIPNAVNFPLSTLRKNWEQLDRSKPTVIFCQSGLRGYVAEQFLRAKGFQVRNLSGGYLSWKQFFPPAACSSACTSAIVAQVVSNSSQPSQILDVRSLACPGPVVRLKQEMDRLTPGESIQLLAPCSFAADLASWIDSSGNQLLSLEQKSDHLIAVVAKGQPSSQNCAPLPARNAGAIVLFSNDLDKAMAALIIACGMAASGAKVGIFFTFWGLSVLRKNPAPKVHKNFISRMFGFMLPKGAKKLALSKMNMAGMGAVMMKQVMADKNVTSLPDLIQQAKSLGVRFVACEMAMDVMGLSREELIEVDEVAGVASFVEMAKGGNSLFI